MTASNFGLLSTSLQQLFDMQDQKWKFLCFQVIFLDMGNPSMALRKRQAVDSDSTKMWRER